MSNILNTDTVNKKENKVRNPNDGKILEIASNEKLKELWSSRIPKYSSMFALVDMQVRFNTFEGTSFKFFIPAGDNLCSLIIAKGQQMININWDINRASDTDIQDYLKSLPNIGWDKPIIVNGTHAIVEEMKSILKSPGLCGPERTPELNFDGDVYAYKGTYERIPVPDGYKLGKLKPEQAAYILDMSAKELKIDESEESLREQLSKNPSVALYRIADDGEEEQFPIAWTTVRMLGQYIGRTFTMPELRRRGFSKIVKMEMINIIHEKGFEPKVAISKTNTTSIAANLKLGFIKQGRSSSIKFQ